MRRVLLTGAQGYIGTVLARRLKEWGYSVRGVDALFYRGGDLYQPGPGPEVCCRDTRRLQAADLDGYECVVHLAELSNDSLGELSPELTREVNILATARLARLARAAGVRRWIQFSSCSVYGFGGDRAVDEESPVNPLTEYASAKVASEAILKQLRTETFAPVLLRNATVYGASPRIRLDLVANQFAAMGLVRKRLDLASDGTPIRPVVHILDVCEAVRLVLEAPAKEVAAETFNVGADDANHTVAEIADAVRRIVAGCRISFGSNGADRRSYRVAFSKIRERLSFQCRWDLESGVAVMLDAMRAAGLAEQDLCGTRFFRLPRLRERISKGELDSRLFDTGAVQDGLAISAAR